MGVTIKKKKKKDKLLCIKQINNKFYYTAWGTIFNIYKKPNGKNMKKNIYICIYTHIYVDHFSVQQKLTQHCKSAILQLEKNKTKQELRISGL